MKAIHYLIAAIISAGCFGACQKHTETGATRTFYMGTTPFPADFTQAELDNAYDFINDHCDIVSHHFDDGIPYEEAFENKSMPANLQQDVQMRMAKTAVGKKIFLSVSVLDLTRKERADYYKDDAVSDNVKNYWRALPFNDPKIIAAYINYISWLIDTFHPIYVNYGVESNADTWIASGFLLYKEFLSQVYSQLKLKYPEIAFFVSFMVNETNQSYAYASQLLPYTDFIGLSAYPYTNVSTSADGNTNPAIFPANYFTKFINLDASKPLAFAETGYIAQDLSVPAFGLSKHGTEAWQEAYLEFILQLCNERKAKLLIWFCHKDYDAGIVTLKSMGLYQSLFEFWRDTGLIDESGRERPAYEVWLEWMKMRKI